RREVQPRSRTTPAPWASAYRAYGVGPPGKAPDAWYETCWSHGSNARAAGAARPSRLLPSVEEYAMTCNSDRRRWIAVAGTSVLVAAMGVSPLEAAEKKEAEGEPDVPAVEDLMREHGVLRRALLIYSEA